MNLMRIQNWGLKHPKRLFLIDASGALLSAFLLAFVLVEFEDIFGIPKKTLYFLAVLPCTFVVYDLFSYKAKPQKTSILLKGIALINITYCSLSVSFGIYHYQQITFLGWSYILIEVLIILTIAFFEWNIGKRLVLKNIK
jgi:hypothetical protein